MKRQSLYIIIGLSCIFLSLPTFAGETVTDTDRVAETISEFKSPRGAGVFITAIHKGKKYVLLCKRRTGSGWVNPGGLSDYGESYKETAIRETKEELLDLLTINIPDKKEYILFNVPPNTDEFRPKGINYALYLLNIKPFPTSLFMDKVDMDHEISEIRWIQADDYLKITLDKDGTGEVKALSHDLTRTETIFISIYSELLKLTNRNEMYFRGFLDKSSLKDPKNLLDDSEVITDRVEKGPKIQTDTVSAPPTDQDDPTASIESTIADDYRQKWKETVLNKVNLNKKIKELYGRDNQKEVLSRTRLALKNLKMTQTEAHLSVFLGKNYVPGKDAQNFQYYLSKVSQWFYYSTYFMPGFIMSPERMSLLISLEHDPYIFKTFEKCMQNERRHRDLIVFYNAAAANVGFMIDVLTEFRKQLMIDPMNNLVAFRIFDQTFNNILDVNQFLLNIDLERLKDSRTSYNYLPGYMDKGLSTNIFLTGNATNLGSSTLFFFVSNQSERNPEFKPLQDFFAALKIPDYTKDFYGLFKAYKLNNDSYLYQIFIDPERVNNVAYISEIVGEKLKMAVPKATINKNYYSFSREYTLPTYAPLDVIPFVRYAPKKYEEILRYNYTKFVARKRIDDYHYTKYLQNRQTSDVLGQYFSPENPNVNFINFVEARIFLRPSEFYDSKYVKVFTHHRFRSPELDEQIKDDIRLMVKDILTRHLDTIVSIKEDVLGRPMPLQKLARLTKKKQIEEARQE